jgi:hypothetical protein
MEMLDFTMTVTVKRKEAKSTLWTNIRMLSITWISRRKTNSAQVVEMMDLSSFSITNLTDKRVF